MPIKWDKIWRLISSRLPGDNGGSGEEVPVGVSLDIGDTIRTYEVGLVTFATLAQVFH